jgi:hypothetical protein
MPARAEPLLSAQTSIGALPPLRVLSAAALLLRRLWRRPATLAVSEDWLHDHVRRAGNGHRD